MTEKIQRLNREYYWQLRIGTVFPKGLNNYPIDNQVLTNSQHLNTSTNFELLDNRQALLEETEQ